MIKILDICIPTFNRVLELKRQVEYFISEVSELQKSVNLYISDNCSNDSTWEYLNNLIVEHPWISIHRNEENKGLVGNLYELQNISKSKYIWFVSDDDIFECGIVKEALSIINGNSSIGSIFINSELWKYNEQGYLEQEATEIISQENASLRPDKYDALLAIFRKKNTALMWISAWILDRRSVEDVKLFPEQIFHLTEPLLFAANSLNYGPIYITANVYIKNGSKLTSTWATNNEAVFRVHFLGFYNAILKLPALNYSPMVTGEFLKIRTQYLIQSNPTYFINGLIKYPLTTINILRKLSLVDNLKLLAQILHKVSTKVSVIKTIILNILAVRFLEIKYTFLNNYSKNRIANVKEEFIVSLTTYPKRTKKVFLTIESLFNQNTLPDKVILWLSKEEYQSLSDLPKSLLALQKRGLLIEFVEANHGPYKKLVYSYKLYPNSTIITVDDDILYPPEWLAELIRQHNLTPGCIIAYHCKNIELNDDQISLKPYFRWQNTSSIEPSISCMPIGAYGVLYPPNSLHDDLTEVKLFSELSPMTDDIWFKAMALLQNVKARQVHEKSPQYYHVSGSQDSALYHSNIDLGKNDKNLKLVFNHYRLYSQMMAH